ncbi:sensor histidine kinase [Halostella salina]|uniref:sensor histidine kinase n=1 Tax=Halostella salina TaxID=1547897 RepID=UPI000EF833FD|nr:HAMP domain-containing sensor histidine kinase [Halostella salina]
MKLRTKSALLLLAIVVVLGAVNVGALLFYQNQLVQQERANVEGAAGDAAGSIDEQIESRKDEVQLFAAKHPNPARLNESDAFLERTFDTSRFWAAHVVDADGTVVSVFGPYTEENRSALLGSNVSDERYIRIAQRTGAPAASQPESVPTRNAPSISFAAPVRNDEMEIVGVVVARLVVNDRTLFGMLPALQNQGQQAVEVSDGEGHTLVSPLYEFDRTVGASATVEDLGWTVTVTRNQGPLNRTLRELALIQGLGLLVIVGSVVGFGAWQYRANLRQTERLLDGFDRIRDGEYSYRLDMASAEEWEQISDGFNHLARGLAAREAELREREQRLGVLNRVLRHNLRNEMTVILNYAELLRETADDGRTEQAAATIVETGRDLTDLSEKARQIEEALDDEALGLEDQEVVGIVEGIVADLREEYPDAEINLSAPETQQVAAVESLWIAVRNVCENALEHTDADEPRVDVTVETEERDGETRVRVTVADNGPGIPDQEKNVLVEGEETSLQHGSGLGLWLVYWVVDKSRGTLVFDENDPRGSVVTLDLPASKPDDYSPSAPTVTADDGATVVGDD